MSAVDLMVMKDDAKPTMPTPYALIPIKVAIYRGVILCFAGGDGTVDGDANRRRMMAGSNNATETGAKILWVIDTSYRWLLSCEPDDVAVGVEVGELGGLGTTRAEAHAVIYCTATPAPLAFTPV
jgi:hypothetical protein